MELNAMVNHEDYMKQIEQQMHGAMTQKERMKRIDEIVSNYRIAVEEETNEPYRSTRDIFDIMTDAEIADLKRTHNCPICGFEFVGYPTGWAWEIHIRDCLEAQGRR
jgi:hypothetical protein